MVKKDIREIVEIKNVKIDKQVANIHNNLLQARRQYTLEEIRLMDTIISFVQPNDKEFKKYKIPISIFYDNFFTKNRKDIYNVVKRALKGLLSKPILIEGINENGKRFFEIMGFISYGKYIEGEGSFVIKIEEEFKPYLLDLKKFFSKIPIKYTYILTSRYSIRLYELLKQYENTGYRIDKVDELREMLGIEKKEYKLFSDFDKRVLKAATNEINEKTDISVEYNKKKTGRKITHIEFFIESKYPSKNTENDKNNQTKTAENTNKEEVESIETSPLMELKNEVKSGLPYLDFKHRLMKIQNADIANFIDGYYPYIILRTNEFGHLELFNPKNNEIIKMDAIKDKKELEGLRRWLYKNPNRIGDIKEINEEELYLDELKDKLLNKYKLYKTRDNLYHCLHIKHIEVEENIVKIFGDDILENRKNIYLEIPKDEIESFALDLKDEFDKDTIGYYKSKNNNLKKELIQKEFNTKATKENLSKFAEYLDNKSLKLSEDYVKYEKENNQEKMEEIKNEIAKLDETVINIMDYLEGSKQELSYEIMKSFLDFNAR